MSRSVTKSLTGKEMGHYGSVPFFCNIIRIEVRGACAKEFYDYKNG